MHGVVRSIGKIKLPRAIHRPSLAGTGLPERMRTTAFAFLGLTAASGLALVAIFAQINFHVLSPAPLPGEPGGGGSSRRGGGAGSRLGDLRPGGEPASGDVRSKPGRGPGKWGCRGGRLGRRPRTPRRAGPAPPGPERREHRDRAYGPPRTRSGLRSRCGPRFRPGRHANRSRRGGTEYVTSACAGPGPAGLADAGGRAGPRQLPSSAAAAHASERGIEASSKSSASVEVPVSTAGTSPPPSADPGNGNGKALGHTK